MILMNLSATILYYRTNSLLHINIHLSNENPFFCFTFFFQKELYFIIFQVSSDILRLSGYSNQFRTLLTGRSVPRRESGPGALLQDFSDNKG
uniref:Ovule protein n=1 Tax=Ascaris lumbricoides TaxID=6252 RepID=A0A0M3HFH8_ASCLU